VSDASAAKFRELASGPLPDAVRKVLTALDPELAADPAVLAAVVVGAQELGQSSQQN
jgi:fructuronate reductase